MGDIFTDYMTELELRLTCVNQHECRLPITDNEGAIGSALYFCGNCVSQCRVTQPKRLLQWKQDHSNCDTICYRCLIQAKIYPEQFTTEHSYINALVEYENHLTDSF